MEDSPHTSCTAHSGMNVKINILLSLSSIAVALLLALFPVAVSIQSGVSINTTGIVNVSGQVNLLRESTDKNKVKVQGQIERIQKRLRDLE
jgi:hypothetical protein